jgi:hypothetical protein
MDNLNAGEHITIQQVSKRLARSKSICSVRLIELVNAGKLEKIAGTHIDHQWKKRRTIVNPLSTLWTKKALKVAYAS